MEKVTYCLGSYSCIELLKSKRATITKCFIQKKFKNQKGYDVLFSLLPKNIEVIENEKFLKKISFKENIYVALEFIPYEMEFDSNDIVILDEDDEGTLGSIIRTSCAFNFKNIAIISSKINIFSTKLLRSSMGSFFSLNIKIFPNINEIQKNYKNNQIYIKKNPKIPYHVSASIQLYKLRKN